ncbi:MAG: type II toxin-antitoxin system RelE/ParE family toxin [Treponema sp.]|nr:type II toxin-antitoxin system RelE/ParE family toxin [Treponema sp.]
MFDIRYLPSFKKDLKELTDYISINLKAPKAALDFIDTLEKSIENLKIFPLAHRLYRPPDPIETEYRVMPVKNYLVFYIAHDDIVEIHRVIYKKRNLPHLIVSKKK